MSLPFGGGVGPAALGPAEGPVSAGFRMLKPLTGPPIPTPGDGRPGTICVGFLVKPGSVLSRFSFVGEGTTLFEVGDVSSRALDGTASAVLARSTPAEGGESIFVSTTHQRGH